jgi:hypothetical protein
MIGIIGFVGNGVARAGVNSSVRVGGTSVEVDVGIDVFVGDTGIAAGAQAASEIIRNARTIRAFMSYSLANFITDR